MTEMADEVYLTVTAEHRYRVKGAVNIDQLQDTVGAFIMDELQPPRGAADADAIELQDAGLPDRFEIIESSDGWVYVTETSRHQVGARTDNDAVRDLVRQSTFIGQSDEDNTPSGVTIEHLGSEVLDVTATSDSATTAPRV
jgi:hypothetical protein